MKPGTLVIDLSHHNVVPTADGFFEAKRAGIVGVIHKCTEGETYVDDDVEARYYLAQEAGLLWGIYHFLRPGDMDKQAHHFLETAEGLAVIDADTLLVADHEDRGVPIEDLKKFLDIIEHSAKRSPVVYSGHVIKEQLAGTGYHPKRRLWLCQYAAEPVLPEGVSDYWLWQYTDKGECPGIQPPTDLNHYQGTPSDLVRDWARPHKAPEPKPPRPAEEASVTIEIKGDVRVNLIVNGTEYEVD